MTTPGKFVSVPNPNKRPCGDSEQFGHQYHAPFKKKPCFGLAPHAPSSSHVHFPYPGDPGEPTTVEATSEEATSEEATTEEATTEEASASEVVDPHQWLWELFEAVKE